MANNQITKEALATALKKLLEKQPLSKISVKPSILQIIVI